MWMKSSSALRLFFPVYLLSTFLTTSAAKTPRPLEGRKLRCCTLVESPMVYEDPTRIHTHGFAGLAIDYLTLLEGTLGFQCETLNVFKATNPKRQGFTGFVYEMEECTKDGEIISSPNCTCDIGVGGWVLNEERLGRVDFVPNYISDDFRVLTHVDNVTFRSTDGAFFLTAFAGTTWIAVFGLILTFIFLKLFDRSFAPSDPERMKNVSGASRYHRIKHYLLKSHLLFRVRRATQSTLLKILGQSTEDIIGDSKTTRQWILNYMVLLCGLFLILAYEATMTALLVQEVEGSEFRNLEDLKSCRVPAREICLPAGGAAFAFWQKAIKPSPCNRRGDGGEPTIVNSYDEGHAKVASKQCKYFLASGATTRDAASGRFCGQVKTTGESFFPNGISYLLPRGSSLTETFANQTLRLLALDSLATLDKYIRERGTCETRASISLTFGKLKVFFVTAFSACGVMLFFMILDPQRETRQAREVNKPESDKNNDSFNESSTEEFGSELSAAPVEV